MRFLSSAASKLSLAFFGFPAHRGHRNAGAARSTAYTPKPSGKAGRTGGGGGSKRICTELAPPLKSMMIGPFITGKPELNGSPNSIFELRVNS